MECLAKNNWDYHLETRDNKFNVQNEIINNMKENFVIPPYFPAWLSGFIEAVGCFRTLNNKAASFYISPAVPGQGQKNYDYYILNAIKTFYNSHHKIGIQKDPRYLAVHYRISISGLPCLTLVKEHLTQYPLLGNKKLSFDKWSDLIK